MGEKTGIKMMIGELLVKEGYLSEKQLKEAITRQNRDLEEKTYVPLGEICVKMKYISRADLQQFLKKHRKRIQLGELLVNMGLVSYDEIDRALEMQKIEGKRLGQLLVEMGFITESHLINTLSAQLGIPKIIPTAGIVDPAVLKGLSKAFLQRNECLPICRNGDCVTVIMNDPLAEDRIRLLEGIYKARIEPAMATTEEIQKGIKLVFDDLGMIQTAPEHSKSPFKSLVITDGATSQQGYEDNTIKVANYIITNAINDGATDIHIEPLETMLRIRYRIDGILQHKTDLPLSLAVPLVGRIKALSALDISDKRRHQDGRIGVRAMNKSYDLRVSTFASITGETVAIRILSHGNLMDIDMLGFSPHTLAMLKEMLKIPSGIVLITGPSGCGKTTSLYASMNYLNNMEKKIITIEDPIEYTVSGIIQGQVSDKTGLSYKNCVKAILRQDPDVIMIGEIRDKDSAEAAVETCLTGHKVLTSFHTDDTAGALLRMLEMGIETFLISSTVMSVISQRLIRTLCPICKEPATPDEGVFAAFDSIRPLDPGKFTFYSAVGCSECNNGYKGRTAVSELMVLNSEVRHAILSRTSSSDIRAVARQSAGMISLREDGFYKATQGITTLDEVIRITSYHEADSHVPYSAEDIVNLCDMKHG
jgi:type IV pilus assembly protein PilB